MSREELPFEVIQTWKPEQLKEFCRKRDLKVSGTKAELVARVFAAAEMGISIKPTALERIATTEKEKAKLLIIPNGKIGYKLLETKRESWYSINQLVVYYKSFILIEWATNGLLMIDRAWQNHLLSCNLIFFFNTK